MRTTLYSICVALWLIFCLLTDYFDLEKWPSILSACIAGGFIGFTGLMLLLDWNKEK